MRPTGRLRAFVGPPHAPRGRTRTREKKGASAAREESGTQPPHPTPPSDPPARTVVPLSGIGRSVNWTTVWAGAIGVTVLMLLYPRIALSRIVAADIAYAVPMTLVAGLGHASMGSVDWPLLGKLVSGSLPGIWLGSMLITRTPERIIRLTLSVLLTLAGTKLVFN